MDSKNGFTPDKSTDGTTLSSIPTAAPKPAPIPAPISHAPTSSAVKPPTAAPAPVPVDKRIAALEAELAVCKTALKHLQIHFSYLGLGEFKLD